VKQSRNAKGLDPQEVNHYRRDESDQENPDHGFVFRNADRFVIEDKIINVLNRCQYIIDEIVWLDSVLMFQNADGKLYDDDEPQQIQKISQKIVTVFSVTQQTDNACYQLQIFNDCQQTHAIRRLF
jgi:hypothetical protein